MKIEKLRNPYVRGNEGCSVSMIDLLEKINEIIDAMNGEHEPADIYSEDGRLIAKKDESEDERIRKWLVDYFGSIKETVWIHKDITCEQILSWLEKQKEPCCTEEVQKWKKELDSLCKEHYGQKSSVWDNPIMTNEMLMEKQKEPKHAPDDLQKSFEAGQKSIVDNPEQYGLCKKAEWSEEDEEMMEEIINHIYTTSIQRIPARPGSDIGKSWIKFLKSLRTQPMNTIKTDELEDFIDTELHKDEFIRRWPQYAFNVPEHKEGDEYSIGVAVGVGRVINKLRNFIVNKKA